MCSATRSCMRYDGTKLNRLNNFSTMKHRKIHNLQRNISITRDQTAARLLLECAREAQAESPPRFPHES